MPHSSHIWSNIWNLVVKTPMVYLEQMPHSSQIFSNIWNRVVKIPMVYLEQMAHSSRICSNIWYPVVKTRMERDPSFKSLNKTQSSFSLVQVVECSPCAIETTPQGDHRGLVLDEWGVPWPTISTRLVQPQVFEWNKWNFEPCKNMIGTIEFHGKPSTFPNLLNIELNFKEPL